MCSICVGLQSNCSAYLFKINSTFSVAADEETILKATCFSDVTITCITRMNSTQDHVNVGGALEAEVLMD